ncbi:RidA family protein [Hydrogenophaga crassostreae]|uniref:RidA family protein n=1 Tax=Hydrogenophaga crassostreae TaxID=1763535 RepID=UPI0038B36435
MKQAFHNLGVALAAHGLDPGHVVQLGIYVAGLISTSSGSSVRPCNPGVVSRFLPRP